MSNDHQTALHSGRERLIEIVKSQTLEQGRNVSSTDLDDVLAEFTDEQLAQPDFAVHRHAERGGRGLSP